MKMSENLYYFESELPNVGFSRYLSSRSHFSRREQALETHQIIIISYLTFHKCLSID